MGIDSLRKNGWKMNASRLVAICYTVIFVITGMAVGQSDTTLGTDLYRTVLKVMLYAAFFIAVGTLIYLKRKAKIDILIVVIIYWLFTHLFTYTEQNLAIINTVFLLSLALLTDDDLVLIFSMYKKFMVVICAIGIICYLTYAINFPIQLPHSQVSYYSLRESHYYIDYFFCYLLKMGSLLRLCGLFNEPGYLGTFLALILCADGFDIKKKENIILLLAGILTFSLAFYVILIICVALRYTRSLKSFIITILLLIILILVIPEIAKMNDTMNYLMLRINFDSLTSRTSKVFDVLYDEWRTSDKVFFGYGYGYCSSKILIDTEGTASYKKALVEFGIVGFVLYYLNLIIPAVKRAKGYTLSIVFVICFFISTYQRPYMYKLDYMILLFSAIAFSKSVSFHPRFSEQGKIDE